MDGPRSVDEVVATTVFRHAAAQYFDDVRNRGHVVLIRNEKRNFDVAVLIPPDLWKGLGQLKRDLSQNSSRRDGNGGYITRTELAGQLAAEADRLGHFNAVQLSAGEASCVAGLLEELAAHRGDEALGELAREWADRLGKRSATTK